MRNWRTDWAAMAAGVLALGFVLQAMPASAATARHGSEQFRISTRKVYARKDRLRATGVLDAAGYAVPSAIVSGHGTVRLELPKGSIVLRLTVVTSSVTVPNPATCAFTEANSGTYQISKASGRYRGASGSGDFSTKIKARLARSHGTCTAKLAAYSKTQVASGPLSW
jgi:hypothetical protein